MAEQAKQHLLRKAIRLNNIGVEMWENDNFTGSIESFRQCVFVCSPGLLEFMDIRLPMATGMVVPSTPECYYVVRNPRRFCQLPTGSDQCLILAGACNNLAISLHTVGMKFNNAALLRTARNIYIAVLHLLSSARGFPDAMFLAVCSWNNLAALHFFSCDKGGHHTCLEHLALCIVGCPVELMDRETYNNILVNLLLFRHAPLCASAA